SRSTRSIPPPTRLGPCPYHPLPHHRPATRWRGRGTQSLARNYECASRTLRMKGRYASDSRTTRPGSACPRLRFRVQLVVLFLDELDRELALLDRLAVLHDGSGVRDRYAIDLLEIREERFQPGELGARVLHHDQPRLFVDVQDFGLPVFRLDP